MRTHIHTDRHADTQTRSHADIQKHRHTDTHRHTHTQETHAQAQKRIHYILWVSLYIVCVCVCVCVCVYVCMCMHAQMCVCVKIYRTHTFMEDCAQNSSFHLPCTVCLCVCVRARMCRRCMGWWCVCAVCLCARAPVVQGWVRACEPERERARKRERGGEKEQV